MRDRFTCRDCGKRKLVEVHHLTYAHRGHEKGAPRRFDLSMSEMPQSTARGKKTRG